MARVWVLLGISMSQLKAWEGENAGDQTMCWRLVMEQWLTFGGVEDYPATWEGLLILLEDVQCPAEAEELKKIIASIREGSSSECASGKAKASIRSGSSSAK